MRSQSGRSGKDCSATPASAMGGAEIVAMSDAVLALRDEGPRSSIGRWLDPNPERLLRMSCVVLIILWCVWWTASVAQQRLIGVERSWFPGCFGVDFIWHIDRPARVWLDGGDPYADKSRMCSYPPATIRLFGWVGWMTPRQSLAVWIAASGVIASAGAWWAWRCRTRLGMHQLPFVAILVAMLYSTPLIFSMERGQYDLVTIPIVMVGLAVMRGESRWRQFLAGVIFAVAPWAKAYPGLLGIGLLGLRRWDAFAGFVIGGLVMGLIMFDHTQGFLVNNDLVMDKVAALSRLEPASRVHAWNHSLTENWARIWRTSPLRFLSEINGYVACFAILGPMLFWVSKRVYGCVEREKLAFPYLIWIVAAAAFVPPVANDYSLVFLPLAVLSVSSRRDPLLCCIAVAAMAVWWQPLGLPINGRVLILFKLGGLAAVAVSLVERACELNEAAAARRGTRAAPEALAA